MAAAAAVAAAAGRSDGAEATGTPAVLPVVLLRAGSGADSSAPLFPAAGEAAAVAAAALSPDGSCLAVRQPSGTVRIRPCGLATAKDAALLHDIRQSVPGGCGWGWGEGRGTGWALGAARCCRQLATERHPAAAGRASPPPPISLPRLLTPLPSSPTLLTPTRSTWVSLDASAPKNTLAMVAVDQANSLCFLGLRWPDSETAAGDQPAAESGSRLQDVCELRPSQRRGADWLQTCVQSVVPPGRLKQTLKRRGYGVCLLLLQPCRSESSVLTQPIHPPSPPTPHSPPPPTRRPATAQGSPCGGHCGRRGAGG